MKALAFCLGGMLLISFLMNANACSKHGKIRNLSVSFSNSVHSVLFVVNLPVWPVYPSVSSVVGLMENQSLIQFTLRGISTLQ
jgi:hypothetical protein